MTLQETGQIMSILATAYPRFYAGTNAAEKNRTLQLWAAMFADDDVRLVCAAVKTFIATDTKGFPPHIGAIKTTMQNLVNRDELTESEAWVLVRKAISNGFYGAQEEFDKLPPVLQRLVGRPEQLRDWSMMDTDTVQSVVASNVQRGFRAISAREREWKALPSDVQQLVNQLAEGMSTERLSATSVKGA